MPPFPGQLVRRHPSTPAAFKPPPSLSRHAQHLGGPPGLTVPRLVRRFAASAIKAPGLGTDGPLIGFYPPAGRRIASPAATSCRASLGLNALFAKGLCPWRGQGFPPGFAPPGIPNLPPLRSVQAG
jgi:hypothetical protein